MRGFGGCKVVCLSFVLTPRVRGGVDVGVATARLGQRSMQRPHQEAVSWFLPPETASETACSRGLNLIGG